MIMVEPADEDDWEILELNKDYIEEQLLSQVRWSLENKERS